MQLHDFPSNPDNPFPALAREFDLLIERVQLTAGPGDITALRREFGQATTEEQARAVVERVAGLYDERRYQEHCQTVSSRLKNPNPHLDLLDRIERNGRTKLRLRDDGAIQCEGPQPDEEWMIKALRYEPIAAAMRDYLDERQRVSVLVPAPGERV